jgi:hypothetical protein
MSKSNAFETALLDLIFNNAAIANIGDAGGLQPSAADGSLYISLHTADPGEAGSQTTSETGYTSYARVAVARDGTGWTVTADTVENTGLISFPQCTGGSATLTHFGVGTSSAGAGTLLYSGALTSSYPVSNGVVPQFLAGDLTVTEA